MKIIPIKRALISVSDKTGIIQFAEQLIALGIEIVSTGGTSQILTSAQLPHRKIEDLTGMSEMLGGRVKTLHPRIHGGILGKRDTQKEEAEKNGIEWIDLVVVNFYPFDEVSQNMAWDEAIELIDIGGPTMVRAAAKNFSWVGVVTDPKDYPLIVNELREYQGLNFATRQRLAQKAFEKTCEYDALICDFFAEKSQEKKIQEKLSLHFDQVTELRYGENPHQKAYAYQHNKKQNGILSAKQYQGKALSYNNILDAEAALHCVKEFELPSCVIVKHANPCGVASRETIEEAFKWAYEADPLSAFGGIVALNRSCTKALAESLILNFYEVILAPAYSQEALDLFATKPNLRVLELSHELSDDWEMKFISGGVLLQEKDKQILTIKDLKIVTKIKPRDEDIDSMLFAWRVLKHVKSNGILVAKQNVTIGIGAGQVSRIDAVHQAINKAGEKIHDTILASDAFFPFRDNIDRIAKTGIRAIIQPGGSLRDEEVISACNEHQIAMVFTGKRCFKH